MKKMLLLCCILLSTRAICQNIRVSIDMPEAVVQGNNCVHFNIYTIVGKQVLQGNNNISNGTSTINISNFVPGFYMLETTFDGKVYRNKFTVK